MPLRSALAFSFFAFTACAGATHPKPGDGANAIVARAPVGPRDTAVLGQPIEGPGFRITATTVTECNKLYASKHEVAFGVELLVENTGDAPLDVDNLAVVKDARDREWQGVIGFEPCHPELRQQALAPKERARGYLLMFAVPDDAKGLRLDYAIRPPTSAEELELHIDLGR